MSIHIEKDLYDGILSTEEVLRSKTSVVQAKPLKPTIDKLWLRKESSVKNTHLMRNLDSIIDEEESLEEEDSSLRDRVPPLNLGAMEIKSQSPRLVEIDSNQIPSEKTDKIFEISKIMRSTFDVKKEPWYAPLWEHMSHSSLFILKDDSRFRLFLLMMVTSNEDVINNEKAEEAPEKYGIINIAESQNFSLLRVNTGKIIPRRNHGIYSKLFEYFIVVMILLSCITLCIDTPLEDPDTPFSKFLLVVNIIFLVIFIVEAALKIIAFGFFWNHYQGVTPYIRSPWNILDFIVVVVSIIDTIYELQSSSDSQNLSSIKALRAIRALRPLRMISRSKDLKIAIQALLASIPSMFNVLII